jgi:hypothetical protein
VHRAHERRGVALRLVLAVVVGDGRVADVPELGEDHEDLLLAGGGDAAVGVLRDLLRCAAAAGLEPLLERHETLGLVLLGPGRGVQDVTAVVHVSGAVGERRAGAGSGGGRDLPGGEGQHGRPDE